MIIFSQVERLELAVDELAIAYPRTT